MITTLQQICDRLVEILQANAPAGTTVWQDRGDPISREETPAINQVVHGMQSEPISDDHSVHVLEIDLQIHVRADPVTTSAEAVHAAFHRSIVNDGALKQLADGIRLVDSIPDPPVEADETVGTKTVRYRFKVLLPNDSL